MPRPRSYKSELAFLEAARKLGAVRVQLGEMVVDFEPAPFENVTEIQYPDGEAEQRALENERARLAYYASA